MDTVQHYRVGRQGSLLTDAKNLPKRFDALAAAQRHLAAQAALGKKYARRSHAVMLDAAADVLLAPRRTAVKARPCAKPACPACAAAPLLPHGTEVQTAKMETVPNHDEKPSAPA